jgi:hypothetical protein
MVIAAKALHLEISKPSIQRVCHRGRWLGRAIEGKHARVPCLTEKPVGSFARVMRAFVRRANG